MCTDKHVLSEDEKKTQECVIYQLYHASSNVIFINRKIRPVGFPICVLCRHPLLDGIHRIFVDVRNPSWLVQLHDLNFDVLRLHVRLCATYPTADYQLQAEGELHVDHQT